MTNKRLRKSNQDKMLFGVAGGLADYFNIDPVLVRLAFLIALIADGLGLIAYTVLAFIMPRQESTAARPAEVMKENWQSMGQEATEAAHRVEEAVRGTPPTPEEGTETQETSVEHPAGMRDHRGLGLMLIVLGAILLLVNLGVLWWFRWGTFWPVVLILAGVFIIIGRVRRS